MKNKRKPEDSSLFFELLNETPQETRNYVSKSLEIVNEILLLLEAKGLNQKELATKLDKSEAEVSRWLSGTHNFTIRTLSAISAALGEELIVTPHKIQKDIFYYMTKKYRASINEKNVELRDGEKFSMKIKIDSGGSKTLQKAA